MKSDAQIFLCTNCDAQFPKWTGRCSECGKWGTLSETGTDNSDTGRQSQTLSLADISLKDQPRLQSGINELDEVLGGGIVPGSLILLGGDPGIGKSTLSLQVLDEMSQHGSPLYVSGEESGQQIKLRADRLGIDGKTIQFLSETNVESVIAVMKKNKPSVAIIDSVQTIYSNDVESEPGSINQVRACTVKLLEAAKSENIPVFLIGHVTKDGQVAGPKTLEHLVDTVLYLEGDRFHTFRILRTVKNRFGATNEVGVFEMTPKGLKGIENPSALFLQDHQNLPGTVITSILEGTRPFLIEVQALVTKTSYASPQRRASGYDVNRLQLLLAVLQKRTNNDFSSKDVHINIVGGMKIQDPATDLAICQALISADTDTPTMPKTLYLGEVGLAGEIRPVRNIDQRLKEAEKLGFEQAIIPDQKAASKMEMKKILSVDRV